MIQDNNIKGLECAAKNFLAKKDNESGTMWTEDDDEIIKAFCDFSKDQYKDLIQSHAELFKVAQWIGKFILTASDGGDAWCAVRDKDGAEEWANELKASIEKANSIINQQK